ncbi:MULTISPECIES: lytic transglycosylase domain-containing protein [Sphingobium]|uniref:lytic transglycosylase domain-containing protein n=1 Tax=Sphingobium TaxID=165695 RepID=UPI0015ECCDBA|nr:MULTISPECIES: lytic transglycosylase domain-containing protein [Sphingobium]MCW2362114.1 soluble lytic murein transglycosylase-like protein [Sphingobium sp. B10D3B]MCW2401207.1 soluble lytic murein transglycosylase-like protein [Sphingobium sp. B10D7B]MCW2408187.1 soluble lytic murein transglycosylase-like protein [Sphingobium xanthum]
MNRSPSRSRVRRSLLIALSLCALAGPLAVAQPAAAASAIPTPSQDEQGRYGAILAMLEGKRWEEARSAILGLSEADSMRPHLLAELYLAKDSPRVELFDLLDLLHKTPNLPQNDRIASLARKRGAQTLPDRPATRQLMWTGTSPQRQMLRSVKGDAAADQLRGTLLQYIKDDQPNQGEALLASAEAGLGMDGRTELRQRLAWSYFICGDTANARRMGALAVDGGTGEFVAPSYWVMGLAAWREKQWAAAADSFYHAAMSTSDADLRSRSYFWAARAMMADRKPERVNALLRSAARDEESFYGLLARETLGLGFSTALKRENVSSQDWSLLAGSGNVRNAVILATLGRSAQADAVLRHEAALSDDTRYSALVHLASDLSLPTTQLWLAQRSPSGRKSAAYARYPRPEWSPSNGWQVERALVFAHALQESRFQTDARSPADARGLMQVLPGTGAQLARSSGMAVTPDQLYDPAVSLALGQAYLRKLSQMPATGGLLPKVVAAYNAGPTPIERWNVQIRDEGDPLLFIESVPYYETRAYLNAVLRNYWIYQMDEQGGRSPALSAMAQGLWVRFPDGSKDVAVRVTPHGTAAGAY